MVGVLKLLKKSTTPELQETVRRLDDWACKDQAAAIMIPQIVGATTARQQRRNASEDAALVQATDLCTELQDLYDSVLKPHCENREAVVRASDLSKYRYRVLHRPAYPLPLLFLLWLSENGKRFHASSQVSELLSIFNPVSVVEAHIIRGEPLPVPFEAATPARPLLRGTVDRQIDEAERAVSQSLATLMGVEQITTEALIDDFYSGDDQKPCFLVYRQASDNRRLVKGFLVLLRPPTRSSDAHQFNHYQITSSGVLRETRGFVLTLRTTHYFIGSTGTGSRKRLPGESRRPNLKEALKCIAVNRDFAAEDRDVWGGLYLSTNSRFQPITGRCVLVRAAKDTWQEVDIGVLEPDALAKDLAKFAHPNIMARSEEMELKAAAILQAVDNSYEPPHDKGGHEYLRGPLGIVELPENSSDPAERVG